MQLSCHQHWIQLTQSASCQELCEAWLDYHLPLECSAELSSASLLCCLPGGPPCALVAKAKAALNTSCIISSGDWALDMVAFVLGLRHGCSTSTCSPFYSWALAPPTRWPLHAMLAFDVCACKCVPYPQAPYKVRESVNI